MTHRLSVVIPTHNRRASVERTLAALARQTIPPTAFDVIVVADGCTDDTEAALAGAKWPFALTIRTVPAGGPAQARNTGAKAARGAILLFLDDDIEPSPGLIAAHLDAADRSPRQAAVGYLPPRLESQRGFFPSALRKWWESMFETMGDPGHRFGYTDFLTGNVSLPRELFTELGGFDEAFRVHEDYEFGYRLLTAGAELVFRPDAWGHHDERTDLRRALDRKRHEGRADRQLRAKHPELTPVLPFARMSRHASRRQQVGIRIALEWPWLGDRWAEIRLIRLRLDEYFAQRAAWELRLDRLLAYWYWRGFGEAGGSIQDLASATGAAEPGPATGALSLDLAEGVAEAVATVDAVRPTALELRFGSWPIGTIPVVAGAERLRSCHLRAALGRDLAWNYLTAQAFTQAASRSRPPVVSVVIPFRNSADTIRETVASLLSQRFPEWEAILVDDDSTDGTTESLARSAASESNIRVIPNRGTGKSSARNTGLAAATGEWVLFLDSDAWLLPDALSRMIAAAGDADGVVCGWSSTLPDGRVLLTERPPSGPDLFAVAAHRCPFPIHACLVRRTRIAGLGGFDPALETCEDWDLWQRLARTGARFIAVDAELVRYRLHPGSESSDVRRLLDDALLVIERGHGRDNRVAGQFERHAEGSPAHEGPAAWLDYLGWAAGMSIGRGETGLDLLDRLKFDRIGFVDATALGDAFFPAVLRGGLRDREEWFDLCLAAHGRVSAWAQAIATRLDLPGIDRQILLGFEAAVISKAPFVGHRSIGRTAGVHLDLEKPGEDVLVPASIERMMIVPGYAGRTEQPVILPVCDGFVPAEVIEDSVAAATAWPLLRSFFEANLRPLLTIEPGAGGVWRIARGDCLLAAEWAGDPTRLDDLHDAVGWALLVQEVLGHPTLTAERLSGAASSVAEPPRTGPQAAPTRAVIDLGAEATLPAAEQATHYEVEIRVGGAPVAMIGYDHHPRDPAERLAATIIDHLGHELAIAVARGALIGRPVAGAGSIRERLVTAARAPRADDRPGTLRIGRRARGGPVGAAARHATLPASAGEALRDAATSRGEPVAILPDHEVVRGVRYHPDWLWQPDDDREVRSSESPQPRAVEDRHFFESLFAREPDPWRYGGAYEQLKYRQTLGLIPEAGIDRALELGSAEGFFTNMLAPRVGHLIAGDISAVALERARVRCAAHGNLDYLRLDFGVDPIPGNQDLIVCSESLYYLSGLDHLRTVATRMAAALAPGGWLVLAHANVVADDPERPGFDWGTKYGARRIGETFGEVESLRWRRELRCPYYRIQLFEKTGRPDGAVQGPEEIVLVEHAVPDPSVAAHFSWSGGRHPGLAASLTVTRSIPVLMYHRVAADVPANQRRYAIDPRLFRRQMTYLAEAGFQTVSLEEWRIAIERRRPVPARSVLLTFDDGYRDFAEQAWPVCRELGLMANVFLVAGAVGGSNTWDSGLFDPVPLLDWPEIRELHRQGVHFGSHSVGHRSLQRLSLIDATFDLLESQRLLEQGLDSTVTAIAYPFGEADPAVRRLAGAVGYLLGLTVRARPSSVLDDPLSVPRLEIRGDESFDQFLTKLS